ncbi:Carboxyl/Cholinesterase 47 [Frankliniella occidentalis]|nr:Carboxyl/Cholinesterase 47 [Frankliniella occidentalis]
MASPVTAALAALLAVVLLEPALALMDDSPRVVTDSGSVVLGRRLKSAGLRSATAPRDYAAFLGVPYAKPPVGERRFRAPELAPLPAVVDATAPTPVCLQLFRRAGVVGSEDCLTLQIFTPNYDRAAALDVIVYIHGGAFMYAEGPRTGMEFLMDYDVVVVNVDYRLGVLGFLSFEDEELPGNVGMLDQVEALRWVQENIAYFGGNNKSVTLIGHSAGSASVLLHTLSPLSEGLFHKVMGASGSPMNPWTQQLSALANAERVAELANCRGANTAAVVSCLQATNASELVALQSHLQGWQQSPFSPFAPCVDSKAERPFLPDYPARLLENKKVLTDVPLLLSVTREEGLYPAAGKYMTPCRISALVSLFRVHLQRHLGPGTGREMVRPNESCQLISDRTFNAGVNDFALTAAAVMSSPVYMFSFEYRGQFSFSRAFSNGNTADLGVSHMDDYQYIKRFWPEEFQTPMDLDMQSQLLELWVSFAKTSIPVFGGANWTPLPKTQGDVLHFLRISSPGNVKMAEAKDFGQSAFWKSLKIKENGHA